MLARPLLNNFAPVILAEGSQYKRIEEIPLTLPYYDDGRDPLRILNDAIYALECIKTSKPYKRLSTLPQDIGKRKSLEAQRALSLVSDIESAIRDGDTRFLSLKTDAMLTIKYLDLIATQISL